MLLSSSLINPAVTLFALAVMVVCGALASRLAPWRALIAVPVRQHLVYASLLICVGLWSMRVQIAEGIYVHLLGVTAMTLIIGWCLTIVVGTVSVLAITLISGATPAEIPVAWLLTVAIPTLVTQVLLHLLKASRVRNPFLYMLGAGFGGGALSMTTTSLTVLVLLHVSGLPPHTIAPFEDGWFMPLLAFPEAFINGTTITALTVFFPDLVKTFDEHFYTGD